MTRDRLDVLINNAAVAIDRQQPANAADMERLRDAQRQPHRRVAMLYRGDTGDQEERVRRDRQT